MSNNKQREIYSKILEFYDKNNVSGTNATKNIVDFILGEDINEGDGSEILKRFISVLNSGKKRFVTAAMLTTLMANPSFSAAMKTAPDDVKTEVSKIMATDVNTKDSSSNSSIKSKDSLLTINFGNNFKSGGYDIDAGDVNDKLGELTKFISKNPNSRYKIKITASESLVPNQSGFKEGELANMRVQVMNKLVTNFIKNNSLPITNIKVDTKIGTTPWDGGDKNDQKYTKDQYVIVEIFASGVSPCELDFSDNGSVASAQNNYISYKELLEGGGSLTMETGSIPDRMQIVKDGKIIGDTGYFADAPHKYEEWKYVPLYVANLTEVLFKTPNAPAINGLKETKTFNDFKSLIKFMLNDNNFNYTSRDDKRSEIGIGIDKLKSLWASGQRTFVFYAFKKGELNFAIKEGETADLLVYSPIGKTSFKIKGDCE